MTYERNVERIEASKRDSRTPSGSTTLNVRSVRV
jgi:hypothetical protein